MPTIGRKLETLDVEAARRMPPGKAAKSLTTPIENKQAPINGGEDVALRDESSPSGGVRACTPSVSGSSARVGGENDGGENNHRDECRDELESDGVHESEYFTEDLLAFIHQD